jgi:hypothetical protein
MLPACTGRFTTTWLAGFDVSVALAPITRIIGGYPVAHRVASWGVNQTGQLLEVKRTYRSSRRTCASLQTDSCTVSAASGRIH